MLQDVFKYTCRLDKRCSRPKNSFWKQALAYLIHKSISPFIQIVINIIGQMKPRLELIDLAISNVASSGSDIDKIESLTAYVNENIDYFELDKWMQPSHTLRLGIGDCKNQASLLLAMFKSCGIKSELCVGLTNKFADYPGVHAWVRVETDGAIFICDPVLSDKAMGIAEYENRVQGLVDLTPEYLMREPSSSAYGVGEISYPAVATAEWTEQSYGKPTLDITHLQNNSRG